MTELQFEEPFQLTIEQDSLCHVSSIPRFLIILLYLCAIFCAVHWLLYVLQAILGFFEAGFEGPTHCEVLKTGPRSPPTHWRQTAFYLEDPIPVHTGEIPWIVIIAEKNSESRNFLANFFKFADFSTC